MRQWKIFMAMVTVFVLAYYLPLADPKVHASIVENTPMGRVGQASDIVGAAVFLASSASDYITGQTLCLDGGRTVL